uniref:Uncharacterized protein n=1 Tax=Octopus bimaculoides TaxID=37653 RepID=A0A0L8HX89_OCTBM
MTWYMKQNNIQDLKKGCAVHVAGDLIHGNYPFFPNVQLKAMTLQTTICNCQIHTLWVNILNIHSAIRTKQIKFHFISSLYVSLVSQYSIFML